MPCELSDRGHLQSVAQSSLTPVAKLWLIIAIDEGNQMSALGRKQTVAKGRFGARLCENAVITSKTESRADFLWNQQAKARLALT